MSHSAESINILCRQMGVPEARNIEALRLFLDHGARVAAFQADLKRHYASACRGSDNSGQNWLYAITRLVDQNEVPQGHEFESVHAILSTLPDGWRSAKPTVAKVHRVSRDPDLASLAKVHVYGMRAALTFEEDVLRARTDRHIHSILVEGAKALEPRTYDWDGKVMFQLTRKELPRLVGVLMGWSAEWKASGHGTGHDKYLVARSQKEGVQIVLGQPPEGPLSVRVGPEDMFAVVSLCLKVLGKNEPHLSSDAMLALCKRTATLG